MKRHKIHIKLLNDEAVMPTTIKGSLIKDLYADLGKNNLMITPKSSAIIPLGFSTELSQDMVGIVTISKDYLWLAGGAAVIDFTYSAEWRLRVYNPTDSTIVVQHGEKIARVLFMKGRDVVFYPQKVYKGENEFGTE